MNIPRPTLSLRALMLGILLIASVLGYLASRINRERKWDAKTAMILEQSDLTESIFREFQREAQVFSESHQARSFGAVGSGGPVTGPVDAYGERELRVHCTIDQAPRTLIDFRLICRTPDLEPGPIRIEDRGGEWNPRLIERLVQAYRAKRRAYRIVPEANVGSPTP